MLSKKLEEALNAQINAEFWAAYLYLSMSAYFANDGKAGFANWFRIQYHEENDHAMKLFDYVISRGGKVTLEPIADVTKEWKSPLDAFEHTLKQERIVTEAIDKIVTLAYEEKDYATVATLQWFVNEQVEEEETAQGYIDSLKMIDNNGFGIYTLDKELKSRVYTPLASND